MQLIGLIFFGKYSCTFQQVRQNDLIVQIAYRAARGIQQGCPHNRYFFNQDQHGTNDVSILIPGDNRFMPPIEFDVAPTQRLHKAACTVVFDKIFIFFTDFGFCEVQYFQS